MPDDLPSEPFSDEEIRQAARRMGLPDNAFFGQDGRDPRAEAFRTLETRDIAACPGSGKTTLLVAKLTALAEKWHSWTRGICVLSHTNVARRKIETSLGNSSVGRRLLSYPHFIGTIHGFVNEFLALPWLRSKGIPVKMIDTDQCCKKRWSGIPLKFRSALEKAGKNPTILTFRTPAFDLVDISWGGQNGILGKKTDLHQSMVTACRESVKSGYHCYEEMFVWALDLLDHNTWLIPAIRSRFPLLFNDETQDNSEEQSSFLHRIFINGEAPVIRQRFGDKNQAIFDIGAKGEKDATTDPFPGNVQTIELPSSYRFGQRIADLADPLGLEPYRMQGQGPKVNLASGAANGQPTIFLFKDDEADKVLEAYARLLLETFSSDELNTGSFMAVGQVHRPAETEMANQFPKCLRHYWPAYDPDLAGRDPKPRTLAGYFLSGFARSAESNESHHYVEMIASGILRLVNLGGKGTKFAPFVSGHRHLLKVLEPNPGIRDSYLELVSMGVLKREMMSKDRWEGPNGWASRARKIAETVCGEALTASDANDFLAWPAAEHATPAQVSRSNLFSYPADDPKVHVKLSSIHSVKGETHAAVLVLETFYYQHNLKELRPWLAGEKQGRNDQTGDHQAVRMKVHYVAMTRPAHLLCLAMKRSSFENKEGELDDKKIGQLQERGWRVALIDLEKGCE